MEPGHGIHGTPLPVADGGATLLDVRSHPREPLLDLLLRRPEPRLGLVAGLVVAALLHVAVVPGAALLPHRRPRPAGGAVGAWAGMSTAAEHRRLQVQLQTTPKTPTKTTPAPEPEPRGQVVRLPAREVARPTAADFLAEQDQRADRETRARITGVTPTVTRSPQTGPQRDVADAADAAAAVERIEGDRTAPGGPRGDGNATGGDALAWDSRDPGGGAPRLALEVPRVVPRPALDVTRVEDGALAAGAERRARDGNGSVLRIAMGRTPEPVDRPAGDGDGTAGVGRAGGNGDGGVPGRTAAVPSLGTLQRLAGLPANDALDVEEDHETSLNTFAYRHATFFNRVADAIRREWVGGEVLSRSDPQGSVYGLEDRVTVVHVTIDTAGNVVDLALQEPSGAEPLDEEALRSFRVAGPFPNPPRALFRGHERFSFTFGFNVVYQRSRLDLDWRPY
jgi:TonB family protein